MNPSQSEKTIKNKMNLLQIKQTLKNQSTKRLKIQSKSWCFILTNFKQKSNTSDNLLN